MHIFNTYDELVNACEKLLSEEKNAARRSLLSLVLKDLHRVQSATKKIQESKKKDGDIEQAELRKSELEESELSRLGFACRSALLGNCGTRFSAKGLSAALEFSIILLDSGLLPTTLVSIPVDDITTEPPLGGKGVLFSKHQSGSANGGRPAVQSVNEADIPVQCQSNDGAVNVFTAVVEGVLAVARQTQNREVNDKMLFTLVTALRASIVPRSWHVVAFKKPQGSYKDYFLAIHGDLMIQVVGNLFSVFTRSGATSPVFEEVRSALNHIAKAISKAVEDELADVGDTKLVEDNKKSGGFQMDAAKLLVFCCDVTGSSVLSTRSSHQQGAASGFMSSPNENSAVLLTALGIILYLTVNGGPTFRNSSTILSALKSSVIPCTLSTALLKNLDAFRLSVNVLLNCSITFGHTLVNETETIFSHVFFRVIESKTSSLTQKTMVVDVFRRYIEEPQNLLALFLNYDCNTRSQSVYEQMIGYLAALSTSSGVRGTESHDRSNFTTERVVLDYEVPEPLQRNALTTLLLVAFSNRQWIERFECDKSLSFTKQDVLGEVSTDSVLLKGLDKYVEAQGHSVPCDSTEKGNDLFFLALRRKEAFRKFICYMNEAKDPDAAINFLLNEPLLITGDSAGSSHPGEIRAREEFDEKSKSLSSAEGNSPSFDFPSDLDKQMELNANTTAIFLKNNEDYLDKLVLGDYFAKSFRKPTSRMIFVRWIEQHSFANMTLDTALRLFLGGFKLLGEAEVVDKTMELFAAQYCKENPTAFRSANTAFILSFSICMLNTDAHSPHVKNKMTLEGFIRNNRGIDEGNDVDPALLKGIYERISSNEIKLRPSKLTSTSSCACGSDRERSTLTETSGRISSGILESIPILKHFAPVARAITDTVMIPLDVAGNMLFNSGQRKQEAIYQAELRSALKEVIETLHRTDTHASNFVEATRIENAIPMWAITIDHLVRILVSAFENLFMLADAASLPANAQGSFDPAVAFIEIPQNRDYFDNLLRGLVNTIHVCCDFGNVSHVEDLIERLFNLTQLENAVAVDQGENMLVSISIGISRPRIELLATVLNLFLENGAFLTTKSWCVAYNAVSLLDLISNGVDGIWRRQSKKTPANEGDMTTSSSSPSPPPPDTWFGNLDDLPLHFDEGSVKRRAAILADLRYFSSVDIWLERLFDATAYPSQTQVFMANAMVTVCERELKCLRLFSLTKLCDFLVVCASFSSRMQWRDVWNNASKVFTLAGTMSFGIARSALEGLRIVALTYLMREELLNYSFQKEVLMPLEAILMGNQDVRIRQKVIETMGEVIELRASHLASGWNVVFSMLSHSAMIPEVVESAWGLCERIITSHITLMKDCFKDLVFCLTSFACNNVNEDVALLSTSYLRACGHWLQFGLEPPPEDVRDPGSVSKWGGRFRDADNEAHAAQFTIGITRVTLSTTPILSHRTLVKPKNSTVKTNYHLWLSLLEGMVPIILVHPSVRVRAHVICSLWGLIGQYAIAFDMEIQRSLFKGILQPVISNLLMHAPVEQDTNFDPVDYRLLTFLILKGMFHACCRHSHLLKLACETFISICTVPVFPFQLIRCGLVDVLLRICVDLEPSGFIFRCNSLESRSELWVNRMVHELLQFGYIDIIHFKRTTGWTELHHIEAVSASALDLDSAVEATRDTLSATFLTSLVEGVVPLLFSTASRCSSQQDHFLCLKATNRAYLVLALHCSADSTGRVFSLLLSGFSSAMSTTAPEMLLLTPYLCVLIEFVFILRSSSPTVDETQALREKIDTMCQILQHSRKFCISNQSELVAATESEKTEKTEDGSSLSGRKRRGFTFTDVFRVARVQLTAQGKYTSRSLPERILSEWKYLMYFLGLKYAFGFDGVIAQCVSAQNICNLILLFPSELEEELVQPFLTSCWEQLDVGTNLVGGSVMSQALDLLGRKSNLSTL